jgi:hypothetical protein
MITSNQPGGRFELNAAKINGQLPKGVTAAELRIAVALLPGGRRDQSLARTIRHLIRSLCRRAYFTRLGDY